MFIENDIAGTLIPLIRELIESRAFDWIEK